MANVGTVTINLDADGMKLMRELEKAQKQTKRTASRMKRDMAAAFKTIGVAAGVMGAAILSATKASVTYADKIGKTAKAVGLTAESYQELGFAAKRAGVDTALFSSSMTAFVKRVGEAKAGMGPLVTGLKNLNPELLKGLQNSRNQSEALRLLADATQMAGSATEKAALMNAAFGRSGIAMVNMMRDGSAGFDTMAQKARDLGIVMSDEMIQGAEDAADKFEDLQQVLKVSIASTVLENADSIISLANSLITFVGAVGKATKGWNDWLASQGVGVKTIDEIRMRGAELTAEMLSLQDRLENASRQSVKGFLQRQIERLRVEQKALQDLAFSIQSGQTVKADAGEKPEFDKPIVDLDPPRVRDDADKIEQTIKDMMDEIATFGMSDDDKALFKLIDEGATEDQIALIRQAQDELKLLKEAEEIANFEFEKIVVTAKKIPPAIQESTDQMSEFAVAAARNMEGALADFLFDPFADGLDGMLRGFSDMLRRMAAEAAAAAIMNAIFSSMAGSDNSTWANIGKSFMQGRASGGPVFAGTSYLVGEDGPEVLTMGNTSGMITPNHQLGGGGITNIVNLPPEKQRRTPQQIAFELSRIQGRASSRNR